MSSSKVVWSIKELCAVLRKRQLNKFDVNIGVSGARGDGKSTFLFKIFNSFKKDGFVAEKHQEYSQKAVTSLLANQRFGYCWDDEAINSGYKRDFQGAGQKTLIKVVTNYRDNYNIYASALPFFYSLDKDLRELIFAHIHIIERGVAVILLPLSNQIHASDPWDTKANIKIEEREASRIKKNPNLSFRFQRFTTFGGYIFFGSMTEKQEKKYKEIKSKKRAKNFGLEDDNKRMSFKESMYKLLMEGKLTKDGMIQACLVNDKKYTAMLSEMNRMVKDNGINSTVAKLWRKDEILPINSKSRGAIIKLVPTVPS